MRTYCRLGMLLGFVCTVAIQGAQAFAINVIPTGTDQRGSLVVTGAKEIVSASAVTDVGIPEPGVVALLGFGLVLLGLSYSRTDRRAERSGDSISMYGRDSRSLDIGGRQNLPWLNDI